MPILPPLLRQTRKIALLIATGWCGLAPGFVRGETPAPIELQTITFHGQDYFVRSVDPKKEDLRLYLNDDQGNGLRNFANLDKCVSGHGEKLLFAANAGMFDINAKPVGLLVCNGAELNPLNLNEGTGNFFMKPNGVFLINEKHEAMVIESSTYTALLTPVLWATQSGPLLVQGGEIHPDFLQDSKSKKWRSGVGVRKDGVAVFAISKHPVNFYEFAQLFQTELKCPNALFLDGEISAFYTPGMPGAAAHSFGPIFGLVEKAPHP